MDRPTLWFVTAELPPAIAGGLGTHCGVLLRALALGGWMVRVILTPYHAGEGGAVFSFAGFPVHPLPFPVPDADGNLPLWYESHLAGFLASATEQPCLVHAHEWFGALVGRRLADARGGVPLLVTMHLLSRLEAMAVPELLERPPQGEAARVFALERWAGQAADGLIYVSASLRCLGEGAYGFAPDKGYVVPNSLDPDLAARAAAIGRPAARSRFGAGEGPLVAAAGRFIFQKGFWFLLQAMLPLSAAVPGIRLVLAGDGAERRLLEAEAAAFGGRVVFPGFLDREGMAALVAAADLAVVPSLFEPFGIAALDWMAAGVPVVAAATGGLVDIVGEAGILVPLVKRRTALFDREILHLDVNGLAGALIRLVREPGLAGRLGAAGRERALGLFSVETFLAGTLAVYRGLGCSLYGNRLPGSADSG